MKISILAVGLLKAGPEFELFQDYSKRFRGLGRSLGLSGIDDLSVKAGGGLAREGASLITKVPPDAAALRLDEFGQSYRSTDFAHRLAKQRDEGVRELVFLIGGAEGYSDDVRDAFPETIAFGPQTWPHLIARVLLAEQLYRAASILAGTPYHKA
ncbi:MAG: 23S rRNA (pseudouridine(1915)-N(3))-methyltransferase RlmH [Pseudomonadota bacterium]